MYMNALCVHLQATGPGLVPVGATTVLSKEAIIGLDISPQVWVIGPRGVHHDSGGPHLHARLVAVIVDKDTFM